MHFAKAKASSFPFRVVLAVLLVGLILDAFTIYRVQHLPSVIAAGASAEHMIYLMLGGQWVTMVFSAAIGLGYAQWLMERRRVELPWYAIFGVAVCYALLLSALNYGWAFVQHMAMGRAGFAGMQALAFLGMVVMRAITLVAIMLPLGLAFHIARVRAASLGEMRWRSLLIFALLVWAWHLMIVQMLLPSALAAAGVYGLDLWSMAPWLYAGSFVLVLPIWLGAWLAWPASMQSARVTRVVLASFLTAIINIVSMLAVALITAVAMPHSVMEDATLATVVALVAALLWFVITLPLCWLSVKALMRNTSENVSVEQGYRLGENSV